MYSLWLFARSFEVSVGAMLARRRRFFFSPTGGGVPTMIALIGFSQGVFAVWSKPMMWRRARSGLRRQLANDSSHCLCPPQALFFVRGNHCGMLLAMCTSVLPVSLSISLSLLSNFLDLLPRSYSKGTGIVEEAHNSLEPGRSSTSSSVTASGARFPISSSRAAPWAAALTILSK